MDGFEPPDGDGSRVRVAASVLGTVSADLGHDLRSANTAVDTALHRWRARRADEFSSGVFGIQAGLGAVAAGADAVADVLERYARAWASCADEIEDYGAEAARIQRRLDDPWSQDPVSGDVLSRLADELRIIELRHDAERARDRLRTLAGELAETVDAQTRRLVPEGDRLGPDEIRRRVDARTGVRGLAGALSHPWAVLEKARAQGGLVLDLVRDNLDGTKPGGPVSALPTDPGVLGALLRAARLDRIDPIRYAGLLHQYWVARAAAAAGIGLDAWAPERGVDGNRATISAVYGYYGRLFLKDDRLQWAGMANMVGPSFAAGFMDLDLFKDIAATALGPAEKLPDWAKAGLPPQLRVLDIVGDLSAHELAFYEHTFLAMQKKIFFDQGAMHQAYVEQGTIGIDRLLRAGVIDEPTRKAWHDIDRGSFRRVSSGNRELLWREQNRIIDKQYNQMNARHGVEGDAVTYLMTVVGEASIPGARTPAEYRPLRFEVEQSADMFGVGGGGSVAASTPLPGFNVSDRADRWDYVDHDTLPAYRKLLAEDPDRTRRIIASDVNGRIEDQRLVHRLPGLAEDLLTEWDIDVHAEGHAGPLHLGF